MKKIPQRMCIVTHEKKDKRDLLRIVRTPEGEVVIDLTGKVNGKGAYICKDLDVLDMAKKKKVFEGVFDIANLDNIYEEIKEYIK